jgi:hypothetical protein
MKLPARRPWHAAAADGVVLATAAFCIPDVAPVTPIGMAIIAGAVGLIPVFFPWIELHLLRHRRERLVVGCIWSVLVTAILLGNNLQAEWSIIDDHEIVYTLGPQQQLSFGALVTLAATHREIGSPALGWTRYRPSYYLLRISECYLWGDHPTLWYLCRFVLFAISVAIFWKLVARWLGSLLACLLILATLTYPFWADIWSRLGPAEIYAVFGVALYLQGLCTLCLGKRRVAGWLLLTAGALVAMGSKENFLLLVPCTWLLAAWLWRRKRLGRLGATCTLLATAAGLFIGSIVFAKLKHSQVDVYQASVAPEDRFNLLKPALETFINRAEGTLLLWGGLVTLAITACAFLMRPARRRLRSMLTRGLLAAVGGELLFVSQYVFYNGDWPNERRYDFPGLLVYPFLGAVELWLLLGALRSLRISYASRQAVYGWALAGLAWVILDFGFPLIEQVSLNVRHTLWFSQALDRIVARLQAEPARPLVFVSHRAWDYEPVLSLKRFLYARRVRNPIFLRLTYSPEDYEHPSGIAQAKELRELSEKGCYGSMPPPWTFQPLGELPEGRLPLGIGFSGPPGPQTESLGLIWR